MSSIRPYRPADRDDVYDVCVRTGAAGTDATGLYSDDSLLPDIFAGPYVAYRPELAFVVDTGERVAGYVIAVEDSRAFARWYDDNWLPGFRSAHPLDPALDAREREVIGWGLDPHAAIVPEVDDYPAHLHIDLLPESQGQGFGRRLIRRQLRELRDRGVPALYLGVSSANTAAQAFYRRLGFHELPSSRPSAPVLGIATDADV
ncbi:GNAT family N-acetyltransferase [uncultured Leifsonia sp.]|uniref:GNAT family N-acetyltransferase n=1 Tax=uncultured Leifsonia sp. TaxID=340359 RepID=UPI0025F4EA4B|nr:GNAT family N-acetyltransferase [uncultured Leifsonia sp.]